jgi:hypothetical protein
MAKNPSVLLRVLPERPYQKAYRDDSLGESMNERIGATRMWPGLSRLA